MATPSEENFALDLMRRGSPQRMKMGFSGQKERRRVSPCGTSSRRKRLLEGRFFLV